MSGPRRETTAQSTFPDLRILPVDSLLPHEEHDALRARPLVERIRQATHWLNPPVVAPIDSSDYFVILDGANRHHALQTLGYHHILVQVVSYDSDLVCVEPWHHAVRGLEADELLASIRQVPGAAVRETSLLNARAALAARSILAFMVLEDQRVFALDEDPSYPATRTTMLRRIAGAYKELARVNRITHDEFPDIQAMYEDVTGIVVFPHYEPAEIMVSARDGDLLPPGITRHIIQGRALRLNYPLEALRDNGISLEEKNAQLRDWVQERLSAKHVRFYAEPTFIFDE